MGWGDFDLEKYRRKWAPLWLLKVGVAIACILVFGFIRALIELVTPGTAPFVIIFPGVLIATLFGGWLSGSIVLFVGLFGIWRFIWLPHMPDGMLAPEQASTLILIALSGLSIIAVTGQMVQERKEKIAQRDMLIREINHRISNNFHMILSLLRIQARRATHPESADVFEAVARQVHGLADIHRRISAADDADEIDMRAHLETFCESFSASLDGENAPTITLKAPSHMVRSRYAHVAGIIVNELVTNATKYAFPDDRSGQIEIEFLPQPDSVVLIVKDNGVGFSADASHPSGLGMLIVEHFVKQLKGRSSIASGEGTTVRIELPI